MTARDWPALPYETWKDTLATLHLWTQIVGKIRLAQTPWTNHSWHVALAVTSRGLTTGAMPWEHGTFQIDFDFLEHQILIETSKGGLRTVALEPRTVADFHGELFAKLAEIGPRPKIYGKPNEIEVAIPFAEDREHASYDAGAVVRFFGALSQAHRLLTEFRARFIGKCSPVHFFWGSFDLAVTRFSGRTAPEHIGDPPNCPHRVTVEAYSHEVSSCGFWPGDPAMPTPVFYAYAYPEPKEFSSAPIGPAEVSYHREMGEFLLSYDEVRKSRSPDAAVLDFCQSTYEAAANNAKWDRAALERDFSSLRR
jgi:Family of unknown function (DUF5996)